MKVTFKEYLPLDGAGTLLHPAYQWLVVERTETCGFIQKAGNLFYLLSYSGYVVHSIEVEKITKIEFWDVVVTCSYDEKAQYKFSTEWNRTNGEHIQNMGCMDFSVVLDSINKYIKQERYAKVKSQMAHVH